MSATTGKSVNAQRRSRDRSRAIGSILVEQGRLAPNDVETIRVYAAEHDLRFGDAALKLNLISQADIDFALAQQFNYPLLARTGTEGVSNELVAGYNPQSEMVEPLRALRSRLLLCWPQEANRRVLAVTSPRRGEGRSWIAANLAIVFAQIGERTLLIDSDMRNSRQHQLFNISNEVGLSALLTGRAGRETARKIHPHLRLYVLPAGLPPPNPQELLGRPVFELVLDRFAEQFDIVIMDTPAASDTADAQILASRAGAALLIARRNHSPHAQLTSTFRNLTQAGVNVLGSVLNEY